MKLYGGIDLHSNNNVTYLLDENAKIVFKKRMPNCLDTILYHIEPYSGAIPWPVYPSCCSARGPAGNWHHPFPAR